jgi:hypothetical protein
MGTMTTLTFWIDVDNTLLANDTVKEKQNAFLESELGAELTQHYWDTYEQVRKDESVVDIPETLKRFRQEIPLAQLDDLTYGHVCSMFENYPFHEDLYPQVPETLRYLSTFGTTVIVSDGDLRYQSEKILNSDLAEMVDGRVMLFVHKQQHLDEIMQRYPAEHFAVIDDKPQILSDTKKLLGDKLTTVFVKQGKYALEKFPDGFLPNVTVDHFKDLQTLPSSAFLATTTQPA